jgi:hypothetical protein
MNREVHVRFWESPEVKVLRATRQVRPWAVNTNDRACAYLYSMCHEPSQFSGGGF